MRRRKVVFGLIWMLSGAAALAQAGDAALTVLSEQVYDEQLSVFTVDSAAAADNRLGEPGLRKIAVLVPPAYLSQPDRRFPVVYWFHGMATENGSFRSALADFRYLWRRDPPLVVPFLMVAVDGANRLGGTWWTNSPLTGRHEDLLLKEVLPFIDSRYRTFARADGRLLAGFSMGGYAAWSLALAYPELFCAAWACSPGIFDETRFDAGTGFGSAEAYGAVFAPDMAADPPRAGLPRFDGSPADNEVIRKFKQGYGDFGGKISRYQAKGVPLKGMRFDVGELDTYSWIPPGVRALQGPLAEAGVPAEVEVHRGYYHQFDRSILEAGLVPLTQRVFEGL